MKTCTAKRNAIFIMPVMMAAFWTAMLLPNLLSAQNTASQLQRIFVNGGAARSGSGDQYGLILGVIYEKQFRHRLAWAFEIGSTIHDGSEPMFATTESGERINLSYRHTTAGAQLAASLACLFIKTPKINVGMQVGVLGRYQSTSLADERIVFYPAITQYPLPLTVTIHSEPQRTLAFGGLSRLFLNYDFSRALFVRLSSGLQSDTNGETMFPQFMLAIGRRF